MTDEIINDIMRGPAAAHSQPSRLSQVVTQVDNEADLNLDAKLAFKVRPERVRFVAYLFFWTMCILAIILNKTLVAPALLYGPIDGLACPPFQGGSDPYGKVVVAPGEGFDVFKASHLIRAFGFNNICSNWDYSPSREITAAYYPCFEYSLLVYIVLDYLSVALHYKKGLVSRRFYLTFSICFPFLIVFSAWFRLIFVGLAYENVSTHTFGFLTLQIVLAAIALFNVWFIVEAKMEYRALCGMTRHFAIAFLFCDLIISGVKIYLTTYVVTLGGYPSWGNTAISSSGEGVVPGQIIDWIWMVFNAIIPLAMSLVRSLSDNPLEICVDFRPVPIKPAGWNDGEDGWIAHDASERLEEEGEDNYNLLEKETLSFLG